MYHSSNVNTALLFLFLVIAIINSEDNIVKNERHGTKFLRSCDDVEVKYTNDDPCAPLSDKLPDFRAPGRSISEVKCCEYVWRSKIGMLSVDQKLRCSLKNNTDNSIHRVLGGRNATLSDFAHMGALGWRSENGSWIFKCGGSLISNKFVLSAAHCTSTPTDPTVMDFEPKIVRLGVVTINIKDELELSNEIALPTDALIKRIIKHPQYHAPRRYYDIALIELEKETRFEWIVHPACLHTSFDVPETATVTGWGVTDLATLKTSPTLQVASLSIIESSNCDNLLQSLRNRHWEGVAQHQVCAGHLAGGIDTCQGDSGGPLQYLIGKDLGPERPSNTWTVHRIVGVTSFGYQCGRGNTPGLYTRVASFAGWIEGIVWPDEYNIISKIIFPE